MITRTRTEVLEMISWLQEKIDTYENKMCETGRGNSMCTSQCESSRQEYAGWIAEAGMLLRMLNDIENGKKELSKRSLWE